MVGRCLAYPTDTLVKGLIMKEIYTIMIDSKRKGICEERVKISRTGALKIWEAYEKLYGKYCQTMDKREGRGGICWESEIDYWKGQNALSRDFNWKDYIVNT